MLAAIVLLQLFLFMISFFDYIKQNVKVLIIRILIISVRFFFFFASGCWGSLKILRLYFSIFLLLLLSQNTSESDGCARSLLMADRVQIVVTLSEFFNSTWQKANCASKSFFHFHVAVTIQECRCQIFFQ